MLNCIACLCSDSLCQALRGGIQWDLMDSYCIMCCHSSIFRQLSPGSGAAGSPVVPQCLGPVSQPWHCHWQQLLDPGTCGRERGITETCSLWCAYSFPSPISCYRCDEQDIDSIAVANNEISCVCPGVSGAIIPLCWTLLPYLANCYKTRRLLTVFGRNFSSREHTSLKNTHQILARWYALINAMLIATAFCWIILACPLWHFRLIYIILVPDNYSFWFCLQLRAWALFCILQYIICTSGSYS